MINNKSVLAIVPARGGSKGLPGKNVRMLAGKPLIAWSIDAGLSSKYIDEVCCSTDSEEIAAVARQHGAKVPFKRPGELATDTASTFDVLAHAIQFYQDQGKRFDYIVLLEPTSPLREVADIDTPLETLANHDSAEAIVGICRVESGHPAFLVNRDDHGFISGYLYKDMRVLRRQEITDLYFFEGTIYISNTETLLKRKTFYHEKTIGYVVSKWKAPEIDDEFDFLITEAILKARQSIASEVA